jgi:hypothetical protein
MKTTAVLLLTLGLVACGKPETPTEGLTKAKVATPEAAPATADKPDPDTPANQFVALGTTQDCLGLYANLVPTDGKTRAIATFAGTQGQDFRKLEGFARSDKLRALEATFDQLVAPMKGKTLFTYTSSTNDDYREYQMDQKAFFDSTHMTWGGSDPMGNSTGNAELGLTMGDGTCVLRLVNTEAWKGQFKVEDETQARAADAARQAGKGHVKFYLQAVSADAANNSLDWPRLNAEIVRVELVDDTGTLLARAHPSL